ncbi:MAG TPA: hypothetical protein VKR55_14790 [Bradyrhizobium sp.]|uniref:hypothetical protein n=1 Tax=Bradyrhizobium sp. TaxID=376 RepID=UPI002BF94D86|nr:hypothetical protein [Bradyrhizobium sp.]HLZ03403.1 hypothetical protein [Bradyrhizobium sp.]
MMWGVRAGLWAVFALCLTASGLLLLPACGLSVPLLRSTLPRFQEKFCPAPIDRSAFLRASQARRTKEALIARAELEIARIARCTPVDPAVPQSGPSAGRT